MRNTATILAGFVSLIILAIALIIGLSLIEKDGAGTGPLVAQVFGWIAIAIPVLVSSLKAESLHRDVKNGELANKNLKPAVEEALKEHDIFEDQDLTPLVEKLVNRLNENPSWDGEERRTR